MALSNMSISGVASGIRLRLNLTTSPARWCQRASQARRALTQWPVGGIVTRHAPELYRCRDVPPLNVLSSLRNGAASVLLRLAPFETQRFSTIPAQRIARVAADVHAAITHQLL